MLDKDGMSMQEKIQLKMRFNLNYRVKSKMNEIKYMNDLNFTVLNVRESGDLDKDKLEKMKKLIQDLSHQGVDKSKD